MLYYIFFAVCAVGCGCWVGLTSLHWWLFFPLLLGTFIGTNVVYLLGLLAASLCLSRKPVEKSSAGCRFMIGFTMDWLAKVLRIRIRITGREQFPEEPFVLVSNHVSDFDPMVFLAAERKRKIIYISKESNFHKPVVGPFIRNAEYLSIDRENAMKAMRTLKHAAEIMEREGMIVGIFPEGTRSKTGELLEFKEGAFYLAKKAKCPIVVMVTKGTQNVSKNFPLRRTNVSMNVLEVIDADTVQAMSLSELSEKIRETVKSGLN